jgi:hypothetical protein
MAVLVVAVLVLPVLVAVVLAFAVFAVVALMATSSCSGLRPSWRAAPMPARRSFSRSMLSCKNSEHEEAPLVKSGALGLVRWR